MEGTRKQRKLANDVFKTFCAMLDDKKITYTTSKDKLHINAVFNGDDIPIEIGVAISPALQIAVVVSHLPFIVPANKRDMIAVAVGEANAYMIDGCFEFNYLTGEINFRITTDFANSIISKDLLQYVTYTACTTTDMYNDKFLFITKSDLTAEQVVKYLH